MKRIVLRYGLLGGAIVSAIMAVSLDFQSSIGDLGMVVGYTSMVLAFLMVYFGVRAYRDAQPGGTISFGRAFRVGILIALVTSTCYVATWEVIYYGFHPDYMEKYAAKTVEKERAKGATPAQVEAKRQEMAKFVVLYRNPLVNIGMTYAEILPVGLVMTLVCAGMLSRRRGAAGMIPEAGLSQG